MSIITINDNATQVVGAVNAAVPGTLSASDNATQFVTKVNAAMGVGLTASDNAAQVVAKVNAFTPSSLRFLHISDTHNSPDSINKAKELMDGNAAYQFTFLTGDYSAQAGGYGAVDAPLKAIGTKMLMLTGNHDIYNTFSSNQANATAYLKTIVTDPSVVWGDSNGVASYWYKDIATPDGGKLRILSMDSYDYRDGTGPGSIYDTIYSQDQVDWFIARIKELTANDYIIIATHEPVVNATITDASFQYNVPGKMDDSCVAKRRVNDFCSARLWVWDTSLTNGAIWPTIMDAYLNKRVLNTTVTNTNSYSGAVLSTLTLSEDFTNISPATFLFYMGGHLHGDMCSYHPDFPEQLILLVDDGNPSTLGNSSDIRTRSNGIMVNDITLNFASKTIKVERIGNNAAESYNGFPALTRTSIMFPFVKS